MIQKDPTVLQTSRKPRELVDMACVYAVSASPEDHAVLQRHLGSTDFLNRLNTDDEYLRFPARNLDVARIIKTLMNREGPEARRTLVSLTDSAPWQTKDPLIELLIRALAADRPASPKTVAFWDRYSRPDSVYVHIVVEVLFINRSTAALDLFERILNDPDHEDESKETWLRYDLLRKRNDPSVLECCERMIVQGTLDEGWRQYVLEALFDFRESWYLSCRVPNPPLRVLASDESKTILARIGEQALRRMELVIPGLREKITLAMKEIGHDWEENENAGTDSPPA